MCGPMYKFCSSVQLSFLMVYWTWQSRNSASLLDNSLSWWITRRLLRPAASQDKWLSENTDRTIKKHYCQCLCNKCYNSIVTGSLYMFIDVYWLCKYWPIQRGGCQVSHSPFVKPNAYKLSICFVLTSFFWQLDLPLYKFQLCMFWNSLFCLLELSQSFCVSNTLRLGL